MRQPINDFDLYFINTELPIDMKFHIDNFITDLRNFPEYKVERVVATSMMYTILVTYNNKLLKFQIILKQHKNISTILNSFDLSVCQIAYDGDTFYATIPAVFSIKTGLIPIEIYRARKPFEHRIVKYYSYGFGIILYSELSLNITTKSFRLGNNIKVKFNSYYDKTYVPYLKYTGDKSCESGGILEGINLLDDTEIFNYNKHADKYRQIYIVVKTIKSEVMYGRLPVVNNYTKLLHQLTNINNEIKVDLNDRNYKDHIINSISNSMNKVFKYYCDLKSNPNENGVIMIPIYYGLEEKIKSMIDERRYNVNQNCGYLKWMLIDLYGESIELNDRDFYHLD